MSDRSTSMKQLLAAAGLAAALSILGASSVLAWPDDTTAQLSTSPSGTPAGGTWSVDLSFVSQGRALAVSSFHPVVTIRDTVTGETHTIAAQPTASRGVFHADVTFPHAGTWSYRVGPNGYGPFFDYPPVQITAPFEVPVGPTGLAATALELVLGLLMLAVAGLLGSLVPARRTVRASGLAMR